MKEEIAGLFQFLQESPTAFHAVDAVCRRLEGYVRLDEGRPWRLAPGGKYFVTRDRSSVIAFALPQDDLRAFQLIASHSDSPTFKLKENAQVSVCGKYLQLDVERYGGMIMSTWFDRPLSIAGRVVVKTAAGVESRLVNFDRDLVLIPSVAIHMNRSVNDGYKYNAAVDTVPLWGAGKESGSFARHLVEQIGTEEGDIVGTDLYLYNRMPGTVWGAENEFISAGRLDDLECVYASLKALQNAGEAKHHANVLCVFDNEEVGSGTKQGADSSFLQDVLRRICLAVGKDEQAYQICLASSFMLSADNAHATHPNHPELADAANQVFMNEGIVIKSNANQKYTTDAVSEAVFHRICDRVGVPVQHFANRSDMVGGSTLGNISGSHVSINTLDIGLAQLAMHSSFETAGGDDLAHMINGMGAFYHTDIQAAADGDYELIY